MNKIAIDFETELISNKAPIPYPICCSFATDKSSGLEVGLENMEALLDKVLDYSTIIAHNAIFETTVIYTYFPKLKNKLVKALNEGRIYCTKIQENLCDGLRDKSLSSQIKKGGYSLSNLVKVYFNEDISESKTDPNAWRLRYEELKGAPLKDWDQKAIDYAINDSIWALKVYKEQEKQGLIDQSRDIKAGMWLNLMGATGLLVDKERVEVLEKEIMDYLTPRYKYLIEKGFMVYKDGKYKKALKKLRDYIQKNFTIVYLSKKETVETGKEALKKLLTEKDDEILNCFLEISKYEKALSSFVHVLKKADPVIRAQYNPTVKTNRTSCKGTSIYPSANLQQMPRGLDGVTYDIRNCFKARPGYLIVPIDYATLELCVCAHQLFTIMPSGGAMLKKFNYGDVPVDAHSMLAAKLMSTQKKTDISYEYFMENKHDPEFKLLRTKGKPISLGVPGGLGQDTMAQQVVQAGITPIIETVYSSSSKKDCLYKLYMLKNKGYKNLRLKQISRTEYSIVYDELVGIKETLFSIYPDLEEFLKDHIKKYLNGTFKWKLNDFGQWEKDELYNYKTFGFEQKNVTYTQVCNGVLMQSPAAIGAKENICNVIEKYYDSTVCNPLVFIHDENVLEIKENEVERVTKEVSEIMIDSVQKYFPNIRITVEAEGMTHWAKEGGIWSKTYFKQAGGGKLCTI